MAECVESIEEASRAGDQKARLLCKLIERKAKKGAGTAGSEKRWKCIVDMSVYSRNPPFKLPLCRKPGKATMTLHKAPAGASDVSEATQVRVVLVVCYALFTDVNQYMLPSLESSTGSKGRKTDPASSGVSTYGTAMTCASRTRDC